MEKLKIEYVPIDSIKPYENNAKKHPKKQIEEIKTSIEQFGFNDPIAIDENGTIIEGHGRYEALKELKWKDVPVIKLLHMTEEQKKAYIIAHNQITMETGFDLEVLAKELESITDIDMTDFNLDFGKVYYDAFEYTYADKTQDLVENILNLGKANYQGEGKYDIPPLYPVYTLPNISEWISFNCVLSDKHPEGKAVHFFIDDYQFERIWRNIDKYVEKLKKYVCVASPDFSPYENMPLATQIFNHYRKHWVGRYLQEQGITVIPTIRASIDERSLDWYLDGEPKNGIVIISNMWTNDQKGKDYFLNKEFKLMNETLKPAKIYVYGNEMKELPENCEYIEQYARKEFKNGKSKNTEADEPQPQQQPKPRKTKTKAQQ